MPTLKITNSFLQKVKPSNSRQEIKDTITTGLIARISPSGAISFATRVRDNQGKTRTITIGKYPSLSLQDARIKAGEIYKQLKEGVDINGEKRALREQTSQAESSPSLRDIISEYKNGPGKRLKIWQPAGPKTELAQAERVLSRVFKDLLDTPVSKITAEALADAMSSYVPANASSAKTSANGQVSKARAYLSPVFDWVAGRGRFSKIGAARRPQIEVAAVQTTHDPANSDPSIEGVRSRVLNDQELRSILPLLRYPAPQIGNNSIQPENDYRPIALRFMLMTAARREEVCKMTWSQVDKDNSIWRKPSVKATKGGPRGQDLPLPSAIINLLKSLPGWETAKPTDFVFPNSTGKGPLGNWDRFQTALNKQTGVHNWHRHDLRRTAGTLMREIGQPLAVIETILDHATPLRSEGGSDTAGVYILTNTKILESSENPQATALARLAEALDQIEAQGK
ncbi:hypothetical protein BVC71_09485 [Marivivens niveibacter]|uniref:Tyr recombinase domain-containing protein n=1 Tax=Marivivens niveibacter TaxID=1930667 RepID=A0A251WWR6_9RHOB|nr:integrase family protein [Marivivens niveibacter]OUD08940.1 hypothetical protein BVC71_09485 [Marivivens niveibacter]